MKKRKFLLGLAIASTSILALAACGTKSESSAAQSSTTTSSQVVSSAAQSTPAQSTPTQSTPAKSTTPPSSSEPNTTENTDANITLNGVKYETISAALAAIPTSGDTSTYVIKLAKGTYEENGLAYNGSATVKISGDTDTQYGADVIIKGHGSDMTTEKTRSTLAIQGTGDIILENLTIQSDWTRQGAADLGIGGNTQAEVLGTDTKGNTIAYNCSFKSHQDTLRTAGKAWFYGCYVEGDVDFIWMEQAGSVALYEKCEIVAVADETTKAYVAAPRMTKSTTVGKGLVFYNSTVKKATNATTLDLYLTRNAWSSETTYYNQVAYINTMCEGINSKVWFAEPTLTEFGKTIIGYKMDQATANYLNYAGNDDILSDIDVANEFSGRRNIVNRIFNILKIKYEKDTENYWDIDSVIRDNGWEVIIDTSTDTLSTDTSGETTIYKFDGSVDQSALCINFARENNKNHYVGSNGATITIPLEGKSYVNVYGYYSGITEIKANTQNEGVMLFNTGSTNADIFNTYIVYDSNATELVLTAKSTTYITKIVVTTDESITETKTESITVSASTTTECVGVALTLSSKLNPGTATNKSVKWSTSAPEIGIIDTYTGVVTFNAAGEVKFTATACDGSGIIGTYTCNPIDANWTDAEWYTTDSKINEATDPEAGAVEIGNFNVNGSAYKALSSTFTFTNLSNKTVNTSNGLKLNSTSKLSISTTKGAATLTVIIAHIGLTVADPKVSNGTTTVTYATKVNDETAKTTTYTYRLTTSSTWSIERSGTSEEDPILYVKISYDAIWDFQNAFPTEITNVNVQGTNTANLASSVTGIDLTIISEGGKFQYNSAGYVQINLNTTVKVPVNKAGKQLIVVSYSGQSNYTIGTGDGQVTADTSTDIDTYTVTEADVTVGYVEIVATNTGYIYSISLTR